MDQNVTEIIQAARENAVEEGDTLAIEALDQLNDVHAALAVGIVQAITDGMLPIALKLAQHGLIDKDEYAEAVAHASSGVLKLMMEIGYQLVATQGANS